MDNHNHVAYDETQIQVLEGLEAVRYRPGMYIGSTDERGLHHLVYEIVDNAVDEALAGYCTHIEVTLHKDGSVTVQDNGRGFPVGIHPKMGRPAVEVCLTVLHAGGKFDGEGYKVSGGLHGVGASVVNALSSHLMVEVRQNGHVYRQEYERGKILYDLKIVGEASDTGTTITFLPDVRTGETPEPGIFETGEFNFETLSTRFREMAFLNKGLRITLTDERRERLAGLINNYENWSNLPDDVKQSVLDEVPRDQLAEYVLSDEHFQSFYDRVIENEQVRERVEKDQARLIEQAEQSRADAERAAAEADERRHELEELNAQWDARQAELRREVDEQVAQARKALGELTATIEREGQELERIKGDKVIVERQIEAVVQDMSNSMTLSRRILEDEMIKQIVSSIAPRPVAEEPAEHAADRPERAAFTPAVPLFREDEEDMAPEKVLDEISRGVIDVADRDYTRNQVANLLICLTQGYILTLAGLPGTGKTSLAQILAGSLGLTRENASRFCEISVEKGWTSYKDFIGYYNPFTHQMEKSNAEVFDAFALLDAEAGKGGEGAPPYLFLLDEANLSSIEHYWSPFLRACDSFTRNGGSLSLGGDATFSVPSHVRFIATVNFDHTTEELSPRFLDRSWVITLDPQSMDFEGDELDGGAHDFSDWPTLRHETLERVFGVPRNPIPPQAQRAKVKEVLDACARHGWSVSPRSQRMMNGFICAASQLMDTSTAETTYAPVDYAVTQKVLPQLNGPAERLQGLLDELGQVGGLPLMSRRLERIVKVGEESGFYQYFS